MEHLDSAILDCKDQLIKQAVNEYFQACEEIGEVAEPINILQTAIDDVVDILNYEVVSKNNIDGLETCAIWLLAYAKVARDHGIMINKPISQ